MADESKIMHSEKLIGFYRLFREALDASEVGGRLMEFDWHKLPDGTSGAWMIFGRMLDEYARELANIINDLTHHVHRLRAWQTVVVKLADKDKFLLTHEFIDLLGIAALGAPYAIKSRFSHAAAHLGHQANMIKLGDAWKDEFPKELNLNDTFQICKHWGSYKRLHRCIEAIANRQFKDATDDFRNAYNHGFPSHLVFGISNFVKRSVVDVGKVEYALGDTPALDLAKVADTLETERDKCYGAFEAFQALVNEQIEAIAAQK